MMDRMETEIYQCPHCGVEIPNTKEKVFKHKTFCKSSYENFSDGNILQKSTMAGIFELLEIDLKDFPWGVIVRKHKNGETAITYKATKIYWSVLSVNIATFFVYFTEGTSLYLKLICLFATGASLVYFLCNLIYNRFASWVLTLKDGKGTFFSGIGKRGRKITFEYNSDSTVAAVTPEDFGRTVVGIIGEAMFFITNIPIFVVSNLAVRILEEHYAPKEGITITTNGRKYNFGSNIPKSDVIKYMAAYLLREMA
jgi:hypothetical protein